MKILSSIKKYLTPPKYNQIVRVSDSGIISVDVNELAKTPEFSRQIEAMRQIQTGG